MKARLISLAENPSQLWRDWDALNIECGQHHPLLQARMLKLFTQYFPTDIDVLSLTQDGDPAALMLLQRPERSLQPIRNGYLPAQSQIALAQVRTDYSDLKNVLFAALPLHAQRLDLQFVDSVYQSSIAQAEGIARSVKAIDMAIRINGNFEAYWQQRPKSLKKNVSRYSHRIMRDLGDLNFQIIKGPTAVSAAVDRYGTLESMGWKGSAGTALHPQNHQGRFYRALLHEYATTDDAAVFELYHQERLVASRLSVSNEKTLVILKTTFNEDYKHYAPGRILLYRMLEHLFSEKKLEDIAFYTNATPEQLQWATESRPAYNVSFYRFPFLAFANDWLHRLKRR